MLLFNCLFCEFVNKNYGEILQGVHIAINEFIEAKCQVDPTIHMYIIDFYLEFFKYIRDINKPLAEMMNRLRPDMLAIIDDYLNSKKNGIKVRGSYICGLRMK